MVRGRHVVLLLFLFATTGLVVHGSTHVLQVPLRKPLGAFPKQLAAWRYVTTVPEDPRVQKKLSTDDIIIWIYDGPVEHPIELFISYYSAVGVTGVYHSPKNCLPGSGWQIERAGVIDVCPENLEQERVSVSELLVRHRDRELLVLYWFQGRGRIISSEYWEKFFLVVDGIFTGRREGSFVRILSDVRNGNVAQTRAELSRFAGLVIPELESCLPGREP
jgi:EpsI family protein